jgi:hypothetical protein
LLFKDILHRERRILRYEDLRLSNSELQNYALCDIEQLLNKNARSLREFETMSYIETLLLNQSNNRLLQEELNYNMTFLVEEHIKHLNGLNYEQRKIYDAVIGSVTDNNGSVFFVYGHESTRKTYLWRTLIC